VSLHRSTLLLALLAFGSGCARASNPTSPAPAGWTETGTASWYGDDFHGRQTASGEPYDMEDMTAAHRTLPFGTEVRVDNLDNGRTARVRINDRGPFAKGRIIDVSRRAARELDMVRSGTAHVRLTVLTEATERCVWVQVGAYSDDANARSAAERLRRQGESPQTRRGPDNVTRVYLGPFNSRDEAEPTRRRHNGIIATCGGN